VTTKNQRSKANNKTSSVAAPKTVASSYRQGRDGSFNIQLSSRRLESAFAVLEILSTAHADGPGGLTCKQVHSRSRALQKRFAVKVRALKWTAADTLCHGSVHISVASP
jgi:hypothetical protein